jgi:hypothetical protein
MIYLPLTKITIFAMQIVLSLPLPAEEESPGNTEHPAS